LPLGLARIRKRLVRQPRGDRQIVDILSAVPRDGLDAVEAACQEALAAGLCSADAVLNILTRRHQPPEVTAAVPPSGLTLNEAPVADCARYDRLREHRDGTR
jgi:hypothetical protein